MALNAAQRATWDAIFEIPTRSDIRWADIESLLRALGASVRPGRGSRVRVTLKDTRATFHRHHPRPVTGRHTVRDVREFLIMAGLEERISRR
jgi:hypothetical protein